MTLNDTALFRGLDDRISGVGARNPGVGETDNEEKSSEFQRLRWQVEHSLRTGLGSYYVRL